MAIKRGDFHISEGLLSAFQCYKTREKHKQIFRKYLEIFRKAQANTEKIFRNIEKSTHKYFENIKKSTSKYLENI